MRRNRSPTFAVLTLLTLALVVALAACNIIEVLPGPPPPSGGQPGVAVVPTVMDGVTHATVTVDTSGSWSLSSSEPSWVTLQPSTGIGPASVSLTADPAGLQPASYDIVLTLQSDAGSASVHLPFSFPDVTVTVARGDPLTSQSLRASANPALQAFAAAPGRLVVGVAKVPAQTPSLQLSAVAGTPGVDVERTFERAGVVIVRADDAQAAARHLATVPGVRYVEAPVTLQPFSNDAYRSDQWALDIVQAEQAWPNGDGTGTTIAIIDRGFDPGHPDLAGNVSGSYNAVTAGSDVTVTDPTCTAHGTHVAGIAAAVANNVIGVAGVAPGAGLLLVDIGDPATGSCDMTTAALVDALAYVTNGGSPRARVVNMSFGATVDLGQGVRDALSAAQAAGVVLVAASGNDASVQPTPVAYPAAYPEVLAVGATTPTDQIAFYSDRGPELWVVAPGGGTAIDVGTAADQILSTWVDLSSAVPTPTYRYELGTSMASPVVAGVAAQLLTSRPGATPDQVASALASGATDLGAAGRDDVFGYGRVDAVASEQALATTSPLLLQTPDGRSFAVTRDVPFTIPNVAPGSLTLTAGTDDGGDSVVGNTTGELYGQATVGVAFDTVVPAVTLAVVPR
ncbi:MAG: S8 family serine peptidase [Deinococcales bacterium]